MFKISDFLMLKIRSSLTLLYLNSDIERSSDFLETRNDRSSWRMVVSYFREETAYLSCFLFFVKKDSDLFANPVFLNSKIRNIHSELLSRKRHRER